MMKKSVSLMLVAVLLLAVTGCGKGADPASGGSGAGKQTGTQTGGTGGEAQPKAYEKVNLGPLKLGEEGEIGPLKMQVTEAALITQGGSIPPGFAYLAVNMKITNTGQDVYTINVTDHFKAVTPEGKDARYNIMAAGQRDPRLQGTLQQGDTQEGWLGYMVKKDGGNFKLVFTHLEYGDATWEFPAQ